MKQQTEKEFKKTFKKMQISASMVEKVYGIKRVPVWRDKVAEATLRWPRIRTEESEYIE